MSFAEKLMELRRSKGWSQEQLGEKLGVTRQTISKWELGDTTPEMEKIAILSEIFGITTDELIKGEPPKSGANTVPLTEQKPASSKFHYEYKSEKLWHGIPLVHVNFGFGNYRAKGVVAIGNIACGIFSLGFVSAGVVSVGIVSAGILILSAVVGLGVLSIAAISGGLFAIGGAAVGLFALGGAAAGWTAMGGAAAGAYAFGGMASATNIAFGGIATGHIAIGQTTDGVIEINDPTPQAEVSEIILRELPDTPGFIVDIVSKSAESIDATASSIRF